MEQMNHNNLRKKQIRNDYFKVLERITRVPKDLFHSNALDFEFS